MLGPCVHGPAALVKAIIDVLQALPPHEMRVPFVGAAEGIEGLAAGSNEPPQDAPIIPVTATVLDEVVEDPVALEAAGLRMLQDGGPPREDLRVVPIHFRVFPQEVLPLMEVLRARGPGMGEGL